MAQEKDILKTYISTDHKRIEVFMDGKWRYYIREDIYLEMEKKVRMAVETLNEISVVGKK